MAEPHDVFVADGLSVRYATPRGWLHALDDVSLGIRRGEVLGLVGESGSGKSTVVLAALGLLGAGARMQARRLAFAGHDLTREAAALRGRRIGAVFQDPAAALNPALRIGLQVAEPMLAHTRLPRSEVFARVRALLAETGIRDAERVMRAYPHQLSGGMKQRAVIATALAADPQFLLLDEPTTALDVTVEAQILDLLDGLRRDRGLSMLLVSHNLGIVDRLCDRVAVLYAGRMVETGPAEAVLAEPQHPYTRGLLAALPRPDRIHAGRLAPIPGGLPDLVSPDPGCIFRPRCAFSAEGCEAPQALAPAGPGRVARCHRIPEIGGASWPVLEAPPRPVRPVADAPLVRAEELRRNFGGGGRFARWFGRTAAVRAVDGVSLTIAPGEILGLVGESGCGKSTLGRLLLRLLPADAGRIVFDGKTVPSRPGVAFRRRAQIVFQNPDSSLNPRKTVQEALRRPLARFRLARGAAARRDVAGLLGRVRLPESYAGRYPHELSGGEKQRVGIARAIASRPDFLVCDEAVSALDVSVQAAVLNLLCDLRDELGVAYLFISHDIGVIAHVADRVLVMYRGRAVEEGPVGDVLHPPYHPYTEALLSAVPVLGARGRAASRMRLAGDAGAGPAGAGCCFAGRCPRKLGPVCDIEPPPWQSPNSRHRLACHIPLAELSAVPPQL